MTMYVYHAAGHPVGFLSGTFIHDLDGTPLGRILGSHVYRLNGDYVGEWFKETVVDRPVHSRKPAHPVKAPPKRERAPDSFSRRGVVDYGYPDVFHLLYAANDDRRYEPLAIAAE